MAIQSNMIPLGTVAPDFRLKDTRTNQFVELHNIKSPIATVVMFLCNHCPYVKHIQNKLVETARSYQAKGICFVAISSNDVITHPQDGPELMRLEAEKNNYTFPYLYDGSQEVAHAYHAACTPDFYVFDKNLHCVYRGRFDDSSPGNNKEASGADLSHVLDSMLAGIAVRHDQIASIGCGIKWKKKEDE